ncbi:MAG: helix-turn-helix transcriptional regulator [Lachnospiraceae bacterium]|nr:helix-turn-helix transcriptional regulator [Lachnospiraceae bacterium]
MSFGETLYTLRKEKNMSQESLAQQLNTSRQAVSKWETNQGFPEMDKLKMMSNLFGVSIDYMINGEQVSIESKNERGYYASAETIEGFLIYRRSVMKSVVIGILLILLSGAPSLMFSANVALHTVIASFLLITGVGCILIACFKENRYKKITEENLILDNTFLTELRTRYADMRKKYVALCIMGIGFGLASLVLSTLLEDIFQLGVSGYHIIALLLLAVGVVMIVYSSVMISTFELIINNEKYHKKRKVDRTPFTFWQVICIIILSLVVLAAIYVVTGGEGHIATWIEKIISKL